MHTLFIGLLSLFTTVADTTSFYSLSISSPVKGQLNMSDYIGRKIVILEFDAANPDLKSLKLLDSLNKVSPGIITIAVPAVDFSKTPTDSAKQGMAATLNVSSMVSSPVQVGSTGGSSQASLFKWLTDTNLNRHFGRDVDHAGMLFFINEKGILYGILDTSVTRSDILAGLKAQTIIQTF
jgi:glutathione peroxidase-family protein